MKKFNATATVRFKKSVLEPQGKAIQLSLAEKGSHEFTLVRVGKYTEQARWQRIKFEGAIRAGLLIDQGAPKPGLNPHARVSDALPAWCSDLP